MISVYIASPYGDHNAVETREYNTRKAMDVWHTLADSGFAPYCPLLAHFLHEHSPRPREHWLCHTMHWLEKCDCLLVLGDSPGIHAEITRARILNKPVFTMFGELESAYGMEIQRCNS